MSSFGRIAYDAYCAARNWKSIRGEPLPHFDQQAPELREAWEAAGQAVAQSVSNTVRNQTAPG